jgi:CheY-like chemotaxis protein
MTQRSRSAPIEVLLIEDDRGDAELTMRALVRAKLHNHVHHVTDGLAALAFVRREGMYATAPVPDLILLDLKLPGRDGLEVLAEIKRDERLRTIPLVVISASDSAEDVRRSYGLHANAFVAKPLDPQKFLEAVGSIEEFWLQVVKLP